MAKSRVITALKNDLARLFLKLNVDDKTKVGFVTTKRIEPKLEKVLADLRPGIRSPILHYGEMRGSNELENVDVLVLIGEPIPHVTISNFEADKLGIDRNIYLNAQKQAELVQAGARGRGIRRGPADALTVAWFTKSIPPVEIIHETIPTPQGRPTSELRLQVQALARRVLWNHRWVAPRLWNPEGPLGLATKRFPPKWHTDLKDIEGQLSGNPTIANPKAFLEMVRRAILAVAREDGLVETRVTNPEGTAGLVVYEHPEHRGAYQRFVDDLQSNVVSFEKVVAQARGPPQ